MQTLTNSYHNTTARTRLSRDEMDSIEILHNTRPYMMTPAMTGAVRRIRGKLCGVDGCTCCGFWGERA